MATILIYIMVMLSIICFGYGVVWVTYLLTRHRIGNPKFNRLPYYYHDVD